MPYKRSHRNINRTVLARTRRFMQAQPWLMTDAERCRTVQTFLEKGVAAYGFDRTIRVRTTYFSSSVLGFEAEQTSDGEDALGSDEPVWVVVFGLRHSTPAVFTALRFIVLSEQGDYPVDEEACSSWANALLFTVSPVMFRKLARKGRLLGVKPIETFSEEDADLLTQYGYVREDGHLVNWTPETLRDLREAYQPEASEEVVDLCRTGDCDCLGTDDGVDEEDAELLPENAAAIQSAFGYEAETSADLTTPFEAPQSLQEVTDQAVVGIDWSTMNRDEVRAEARRRGIRNVSSHTRAELVERMTEGAF